MEAGNSCMYGYSVDVKKRIVEENRERSEEYTMQEIVRAEIYDAGNSKSRKNYTENSQQKGTIA